MLLFASYASSFLVPRRSLTFSSQLIKLCSQQWSNCSRQLQACTYKEYQASKNFPYLQHFYQPGSDSKYEEYVTWTSIYSRNALARNFREEEDTKESSRGIHKIYQIVPRKLYILSYF
jgi:hypothetical protein